MDSNTIAELLPDVIRRQQLPGSTLDACLQVMSSQHAPSENILSSLPTTINPRQCPRRFLPLLVQWLDLDRIFYGDQTVGTNEQSHRTSLPIGRLRELLAVTIQLSQRRGTAAGLKAMLTAATGIADIAIQEVVYDQSGNELPYHVTVTIPESGLPHRLLLERMVAEEKPAHVTADIVFINASDNKIDSNNENDQSTAHISERDL